eukprot:1176748-Prorocentrum_minimum.AAC.3
MTSAQGTSKRSNSKISPEVESYSPRQPRKRYCTKSNLVRITRPLLWDSGRGFWVLDLEEPRAGIRGRCCACVEVHTACGVWVYDVGTTATTIHVCYK